MAKKREYTMDDLVEIAIQLGCRVRFEMVPVEMFQPKDKQAVAIDRATKVARKKPAPARRRRA